MLFLQSKTNEYTSSNDNSTFVFILSSNAATDVDKKKELKEYETIQGANLRKDDAGNMLYFTTNIVKEGTELEPNRDGTGFNPKRNKDILQNQLILKELLGLGFTPMDALTAIKDGSYKLFI